MLAEHGRVSGSTGWLFLRSGQILVALSFAPYDHFMDSFSDAFITLVAPHAAWAVERLARFNGLIEGTMLSRNIAEGLIFVDDRSVAAGFLASYAEDLTFKWGWSFGSPPGRPENLHSERLREIGVAHSVPELTEPLLDLGGFPDPRLAAARLCALALGLLGAGGVVKHGTGGRALNFLISEDPGLGQACGPEASRVGRWLSEGMALATERASAAGVARGYAERHGLPVRTVPDGVEFDLAGGERVLARFTEGDHLGEVTVTPSGTNDVGGTVPPSGPISTLVLELEVDQPQPVEFLARAAPALLVFLAAQCAQIEAVREMDRNAGPPEFDLAAGRLRFGDLLELDARVVGTFDPSGTTFTWADTEQAGTAWIRTIAREHGAAHLAEDVVHFGAGLRWEWVAAFLPRAALSPEETRGGWAVPAPSGRGTMSVSVFDSEAPWAPSLPGLCDAIESAADILQPLVPQAHRHEIMKSMVYGYFERARMVPMHIGEPHVFIGQRGLHEVQVTIAHDGTVNGARTAHVHEWIGAATARGLI
ncbi:DUF6882 domain-containing protein [Actinomadura sp. 9N407]|uniref:DUF6882 domain-containing protein n=1 Tax=Actinomadura sp. 9N407 TaxID=3375154 RepID=UPI0037873E62